MINHEYAHIREKDTAQAHLVAARLAVDANARFPEGFPEQRGTYACGESTGPVQMRVYGWRGGQLGAEDEGKTVDRAAPVQRDTAGKWIPYDVCSQVLGE